MSLRITLTIDTTQTAAAKVGIDLDGNKTEKISESKVMRSQMVLPLIEEVLSERKIALKDITDVTVAVGPGSFTGLRVGITIANALGMLLDIPVNGQKALVTPQY
jgi:tRNA threonylcarbamoyladenosine biosynthesis protein TsaB